MTQYPGLIRNVAVALVLCSAMGCTQSNSPITVQIHQSQPQLTWSGDVDDSATVFVQAGKAWVDNVTGKPVQNSTSNFQDQLPASDGTTVKLASKSGRGTVVITQQPTKDNNYTAAIRIVDSEAGADHYQFQLAW